MDGLFFCLLSWHTPAIGGDIRFAVDLHLIIRKLPQKIIVEVKKEGNFEEVFCHQFNTTSFVLRLETFHES